MWQLYFPVVLLLGIPVAGIMFLLIVVMIGPRKTRNAFREKLSFYSPNTTKENATKFE
ncbi:MAG: hypothetical protein AAB652_02275 [Patescibacteria group bacterium]